MTDHLSVARELLRHLLTAGPQKGARLKVLLAREFERRAGLTFQQAFWNFPKFSAFLAANADLVEVSAPTGPGDLSVSLRSQPVADHAQALAAVSSPGRFLPPALWNAFTNPDPRRHRFFNRVSGEIVHYLEASQEPPNPNIAARVAADPNYVEITPASAEQQSAWLKEFLSSVPVPESKRALLSNLAAMPYSSAINTAFVATLGDLAESWRQFRAARVQATVRTWAEQRKVSIDQVLPSGGGSADIDQAVAGGVTSAGPGTTAAASETRRWLHLLIDSMDAPELAQVLVPAATLLKLSTRRG